MSNNINNIFVKNPAIYDAVVLDPNNKIKFIKASSYNNAELPNTYTRVGVIFDKNGDIIDICYKNNVSEVWSNKYSFKLTGYVLDGTDRTGILSIRDKSSASANTDYTISYNATDVSTFLNILNNFFNTTSAFTTQKWVATYNGTDISLVFQYTFWQQSSYNAGKSGFSLSANLLPNIPSSSSMLRYTGNRTSDGAISNMARALTYFKNDNSSTSYNPSSNVTSLSSIRFPICLPGYLGTSKYQSDHCAFLRSRFGEGENGWKNFMQFLLPVVPSMYGIMDDISYGGGIKNTQILANTYLPNPDGTLSQISPAAAYCADVSLGNPLMGKDKWYLPSVSTLQKLLKNIEYGTTNNRSADPLNDILYKMGGTAISNGFNFWSSSRYDAYHAWVSLGYYGYFSNHYLYMYFSYTCVPVLRLKLDEVEL